MIGARIPAAEKTVLVKTIYTPNLYESEFWSWAHFYFPKFKFESETFKAKIERKCEVITIKVGAQSRSYTVNPAPGFENS